MVNSVGSSDKRKRGVVLSAQGWQRLRAAEQMSAAQHNSGNTYTLDQLCSITGLSPNTLVKARRRQKPVDLTTLAVYFNAFDLSLVSEDYLAPEDVHTPGLAAQQQRGPLSGPIPLESPFYLYRPAVEQLCTQEILSPGAMVRIKAPRQFGKTSLINIILNYAEERQLRTAVVSLQAINRQHLAEGNSFLRWFCASTARSLGLPNELETRWDDVFGGSYACTDYFETYLLAATEQPLLLVIDDLDELFLYEQVATDFFGMLRAWYEQGRYGSGQGLWQQLRLVMAHSTDVWLPLSLHQSPFNVGLSIDLPPFSITQVHDLAARYGLALADGDMAVLMNLVGGHPHLTQLSLFHLKQGMVLKDLVDQATAYDSIYVSHLQHLMQLLSDVPELLEAIKQVASQPLGTKLPPRVAFRLQGLGLVQFHQQCAVMSCDLYRRYFAGLQEELC